MLPSLRKKTAVSLICLGLCMAEVQPAAANVLEELLVQPGKSDNVVRIRFNSRIHFVRYAAAENSSAVQVYFEIVEGRGQQLRVEETLRSKAAASLPGITVSLPPQLDLATKTLLITVGEKGMNAIVLGLYDDPQSPVRYQRVPLDSRFEGSADMKRLMELYQEQLKQAGWGGLCPPPADRKRQAQPALPRRVHEIRLLEPLDDGAGGDRGAAAHGAEGRGLVQTLQ